MVDGGRGRWGSDFSPALSHLSFPQTFDLFDRMPFVDDAMRAMIEGANLLALLEDVAAACAAPRL